MLKYRGHSMPSQSRVVVGLTQISFKLVYMLFMKKMWGLFNNSAHLWDLSYLLIGLDFLNVHLTCVIIHWRPWSIDVSCGSSIWHMEQHWMTHISVEELTEEVLGAKVFWHERTYIGNGNNTGHVQQNWKYHTAVKGMKTVLRTALFYHFLWPTEWCIGLPL